LTVPSQGGAIRDLILRIKLILRLLGDGRVSFWLKIIPVAGLVYLISPLDLIPDIALPVIGELDDVAVLWITNHFFVELCPPEVVKEHLRALTSSGTNEDDIVDAESVEIKDRRE
jgi:uncharacterized membrane protein YkvA (DUF1232 family)